MDFYQENPFCWEDINQSLVDRYLTYLESLGYMKSTNERYVSIFRTLVGVAEKLGLHSNSIAKSLFRRPVVREQDKAKEIYLNKEELEALYDMPLEGLMEQVRDVFLIGCYTAQRFSDYSKIDSSSIGYTASGTKVIRLVQKKTKQQVVIPILDDRLEVLLKKYDYKIPHIVDVILNRYIKIICHQLSDTVPSLAKKERTLLRLPEKRAEESGTMVFEYDEEGYAVKPRWELVSSHTARRSAITNMVLSKKFSIPQMMSVSGHKKVEMFNKYIKLSLDEIADGVASATTDGLF